MVKISQNLSSNSLFHFVDNLDWLIDILGNGFKARYCLENFPKIDIPLAIPMKCFCDIPLGMIKRHMSRYGRYGVGIKKNYAKKNGVTPVIYVHEKSRILRRFVSALKNQDDELAKFIPYFKRYNEKVSGKQRQVIRRYYDERECSSYRRFHKFKKREHRETSKDKT